MNDFTIFQGSTSYVDAQTMSSKFVMSNGVVKFSSDDVIDDGGRFKITLDASLTSGFIPGTYNYQVINDNGLEKQGKVKVTPNLMIVDDISSYWDKLLKAIDDTLAGRIENGANHVTVGDKSLAYYTPDQLLRLREWVVGQKAKEDGEGINPNDEHKILYTWRLR